MPPKSPDHFNPDAVVDQLYDIALDPETLDTFIDSWNAAGLDASSARQAIASIDKFDQAFQDHLQRAGTFLARGGDGDTGPDLIATLAPFENLAAFIIGRDCTIVACNDGAKSAFGTKVGTHLTALTLSESTIEMLAEALSSVFLADGLPLRLLHVDSPIQSGPALFQIRKLIGEDRSGGGAALIITTQYVWQDVIGKILEEIFKLTSAEQGIVRGLVEGMGASAIAAERGTSEGTVRGQIKALMAKMNARSQSEVIRLVLSLRDISQDSQTNPTTQTPAPAEVTDDWLQSEVWKPFKALILPDGRRMDYHEMGPITGNPILLSHMGYGMVRWTTPMIKLAFRHSLRVICPIRAGYGHSDNIDPKADVLASTRADTLVLLSTLGIERLTYVSQGNDLLFAADFTAHHPEMVNEVVGIAARPCLPGDLHYSGMGKWHRFFLSTAKHAPHLLKFTAKAAVSMAKRIGLAEMFKQMNKGSKADMDLLQGVEMVTVLTANAELIAGKTTDVSQAYAMELTETEKDWSDLLIRAKPTKTWFVIGAQDPAIDFSSISQYRESYPWVDIEVIADAGQLLIYQHFETLIPRIAEAAKDARLAP